MKPHLPALLTAAFALALAHAAPVDDVKAAAQKLADAPNYAFTITTEFANSQFPSVPVHGVTEKGGYTVTTVTFNDTPRQTVRKGEQAVTQNRDGEWMTMEELRQQFANNAGGGGGNRGGGGGGRGFGMFGGGATDYAKNAADLAAKIKDAKLVDGAIVGTLSPDDAATFLTFGRGRGGNQAPAPKNASGTVKFHLSNGALAKYILNVKGTVATPNGDERDVDVTTTTEFKNIGATKVEVPEPAKKKLGS